MADPKIACTLHTLRKITLGDLDVNLSMQTKAVYAHQKIKNKVSHSNQVTIPLSSTRYKCSYKEHP